MKFLLRRRLGFVLALVVLGGATLAACSPNPNELIISPQLGAQMIARNAGKQIVKAEATPAPQLADLTPEQVTAGLPEDILTVFASADPKAGEQLYQTKACIGCHSLDPNVKMTGPTWHNLGNVAVARVPGESPTLYLHNSIVNPSAYVVPGYPDNIMPKNFAELLTAQEQADLIAFILQQNQP